MKSRTITAFNRLPIKWKLIGGSAVLILLLLFLNNLTEYVVLKHWMLQQERTEVQRSMEQLQDYFREKQDVTAENIANSRPFIGRVNQSGQMIRILSETGVPILTVSDFKEKKQLQVEPRAADKTELKIVEQGDERLLIMRSPLTTARFQGSIEIVNDMETIHEFNEDLLTIMIIGALLAVVLSALGGLAIANQLLRPVQALSAAILNVKRKGLHERVRHEGNGDELSQLASAFNDLMNQLEISFRQQKQFVEDASHELRTPVTILQGHLSLLNRWGKTNPEVLNESLSASLQEVERLRGIVQDLLRLTRAESGHNPDSHWIEVRPLLAETVKSFSSLHPDFHFLMETDKLKDAQIHIVPLHLEQIVLIILDNAVKYASIDKTIDIRGVADSTSIILEIADRGIGIPAEDLPHVFDRFYRVDKARSRERGGTGLGLAIARRLTENAQGEIRLDSEEHKGTTVWLRFPAKRGSST